MNNLKKRIKEIRQKATTLGNYQTPEEQVAYVDGKITILDKLCRIKKEEQNKGFLGLNKDNENFYFGFLTGIVASLITLAICLIFNLYI
tara:strand:+ start:3880 stop:4146 length:267 start_codon:yes stop_codon:yes gene_type:complete